MPTLKEYFDTHKIQATPDQRSKIGLLISSKDDNNGRILENGFMVKNYKIEFLNNFKTQKSIMDYFYKLI